MEEEQYYVLLETGKDEIFLTETELKNYLTQQLMQEQQLTESTSFHTVEQLLATACELPLGPGRYCQWYATRIDRPSSRRRDW